MNGSQSRAWYALAGILCVLACACQGSPSGDELLRMPGPVIDAKLAQYARAEMPYDASGLPGWQKEVLHRLIDAGRLVDRAFWEQAYPPGWDLRMRLEGSDRSADRRILHLLVRNAGPFDRFHEFEPFLGTARRPPGGGFYPEHLTRSAFAAYIESRPEERDALLSPFTAVRRDGELLVAVPYHEQYGNWVAPAADLLWEASGLAEHAGLSQFLASRAEALLTDDYIQSDLDWIDMGDSPIELVFGPYETHEDRLMGVKTAYRVTIGVTDPGESRKLLVYARHLEALERNLPLARGYRSSPVPVISPMVVATGLFRGGDIAHGHQSVASCLPHDPRVREQKGTKKIFWKNMIAGRLERILLPIAREILVESQIEAMTAKGHFDLILLHEIAHGLGPRWVGTETSRAPVSELLRDEYAAVEEGKAIAAGLHSLGWLLEQRIISPAQVREQSVAYLVELFRAVRFGTTEPHGKASIIALNWHRENGGARYDPEAGRWAVELDRIAGSATTLAQELLDIVATGDRDRAGRLSLAYGRVGPDVRATLDRITHLPIDIDPVYTVTWE
jgi:hypothetical protein